MPIRFSDESKFNLKDLDGIRCVRRPNEQRLNSKYFKGTVKHGWFSGQGIWPIHKVDGIIDCFIYRNQLRDVMLPYAGEERSIK